MTMRQPEHPHFGHAPHVHRGGSPAGERPRPVDPSRAVLVDVGETRGALVLTAPAEREGLEVEIHPASDPSLRTHVWVLPRGAGRDRSTRPCSRACRSATTPSSVRTARSR